MIKDTPPTITNIPELEIYTVLETATEQLDKGVPLNLPPTADRLLEGIFVDPFAFDSIGPNKKPLTVGFVWRLGVARNMAGQVLRNIGDVTLVDPNLITDPRFRHGPSIAASILKADPDCLHTMPTCDSEAFWKVLGYRPVADIDNELSPPTPEVLGALQHATYMPQPVVDDVRALRDKTASIYHEPAESELSVSPRQQELRESAYRVLLGAFVADRSQDIADHEYAARAFADLSTRSTEDLLGLRFGLNVLHMVERMGVARSPRAQGAAQLFRQQTLERVAALQVADLDAGDLLMLARAAQALSRNPDQSHPLQSFIDTAYARLGELHARSQRESAAELPVRVIGQALVEWHKNRAPKRTSSDVVHDLLRKPYSSAVIKEAFFLVATQLDPAHKAVLIGVFDQAIRAALKKIPESSPLSSDDRVLAAMVLDGQHMGFLAKFPSGRQFLAAKTDIFLEHAYRLTETVSPVTARLYPRAVREQPVKAVHDALWYNREYFMQNSPESRELLGKAMFFIPVWTSFLQQAGHPLHDLEKLEPYADSLSKLMLQLTEARTEIPSTTAHPIVQWLEDLTNAAKD